MMEDSMTRGLSQTDKILDASNSILAKTLGDMFDEPPAGREAAEGPDKRDQICELIESVKVRFGGTMRSQCAFAIGNTHTHT